MSDPDSHFAKHRIWDCSKKTFNTSHVVIWYSKFMWTRIILWKILMLMSQMGKTFQGLRISTLEHDNIELECRDANLMTNCWATVCIFLHWMHNVAETECCRCGNVRSLKLLSWLARLQLVDQFWACAEWASVLRVARHCQYTSDPDQGNMLHSRVTSYVTWAVCDNNTLHRDIVMTSWLSSSYTYCWQPW